MLRQYLAEGATGAFTFIVDRNKPFISESRNGVGLFTRIPGRFSVCDCLNGNNRLYPYLIWEKNLTDGSLLKESIKRNAAFGLLEHPKDGQVTLLSPISHIVTDAKLAQTQSEKGQKVYEVHGEITVLETPEGQKLKALIEAGYNPLVSSRGYGSLLKNTEGVDVVQDDYICEGWDVVIKPSFENAALQPARETAESKPEKKDEKSLAESTAAPAKTTLKENSPSSGAAPAAPSAPQPKPNVMNINEIKSRITALRGADIKTGPRRFAESMGELETLHQEVAKFGAEDATRSYDTHKLHKELDDLAQGWQESVQEPAKRATKLTESNGKLMRIIAATAKAGLDFKNKLGEALKQIANLNKVIEETTKRGKGWVAVAESRKQKYAKLEGRFQTACESLDLIAERYHTDTTEMGRRVMVLEFKEKAQTPEIQKLLKEATRLKHLAAIREQLEGKKPAPVVEGKKEEKKIEETKDAPKAEDKKVEEAKKEEAPKDPPKPLAEGKVLMTLPGDPRGLNESVDMIRRLSSANK